MKTYYIYMMTNLSGTLYTDITDNLKQRVSEHKQKLVTGFARKYSTTKLVYFEEEKNADEAHARKKQIKGWPRAKKVELIESLNPEWKDLSSGWYD